MARRPGFTLVEAVISLTIIAMLLAAGYGAFASSATSREAARTAIDPLARAAALRMTIFNALRNAVVTGQNGPPFRGVRRGAPGDDELTFLSTGVQPFEGRSVLARLFIDGDGATPQHGLVVELTDPASGRRQLIELGRQVTGFSARYLVGTGTASMWTPTYSSSVKLPEAVEITLYLPATDTIAGLAQLPILVPLGR
jgi:prepilin-type N-terminal cleavage/methylation domain-containing protein